MADSFQDVLRKCEMDAKRQIALQKNFKMTDSCKKVLRKFKTDTKCQIGQQKKFKMTDNCQNSPEKIQNGRQFSNRSSAKNSK